MIETIPGVVYIKNISQSILTTMGSNLSLIHLPAQSGKTRKMTDLIQKWRRMIEHQQLQHNVNIIFTSNTKLLAKQTEKRVVDTVDHAEDDDMSDLTEKSSDLSDDDLVSAHDSEDINQSIPSECKTYAWVHEPRVKGCKPTTKSASDLALDIMFETYDNIICCTNSTRTRKTFDLIEILRKMWLRNPLLKKVSIWVDEADCAIRIWKPYVDACRSLGDFIENVIMITATMVPVYKYLESIGVDCWLRVYENTHQPTYHRYVESNILHDFSDDSVIDPMRIETKLSANQKCVSYMERILSSTEVAFNSKWFCPGLKNRTSHEEVCAMLLKRGFNVLILNGNEKEIRYSDMRPALPITDLLEHDLEIATTLNTLYYTTDLCTAPFAVTGHLCVGRGVTFASKRELGEFLFTHAIIPTGYLGGEDAYQLVSRCIGNIKDFKTYVPPVIFIDKGTHEKIIEQEKLAVVLASTLYTVNEDETQLVTGKTINELMGREIITHKATKKMTTRSEKKSVPVTKPDGLAKYRVYGTIEDVMAACKILKYKGVHKPRDTSKDAFGRYMTSLNSKKEAASLEKARTRAKNTRAYGTHDKGKGVTYTWRTYLPCYVNLNDVSSLVFVFIIRPDEASDEAKLKELDDSVLCLEHYM
jgi:hypothetical protein